MWFISTLIEFYLIFPVITSRNLKKQLFSILIVYCVYWGFDIYVNAIESRILWCFPSFAFGCIIGCRGLTFLTSFNPSDTAKKLLNFLSISSFCSYLFHRHIMVVMEKTILPEDGLMRLIFLYIVCVPVILVSGYYIQEFYNKTIKRILQ